MEVYHVRRLEGHLSYPVNFHYIADVASVQLKEKVFTVQATFGHFKALLIITIFEFYWKTSQELRMLSVSQGDS